MPVYCFDLQDEHLGDYVVDVSLPEGAPPSDRLPVIVALDGNILFDQLRALLHGGGGFTGAFSAPPSVVVGVRYPDGTGPVETYARRTFDFHGEWDLRDAPGRANTRLLALYDVAAEDQRTKLHGGGADRFAAFIKSRLLPAVADRHRIDANGRHTLIGASAAGHFVLRTLYDSDTPFSRFVCISPEFAAPEGSIQELEAAFAQRHEDHDVDVYLACGQLEPASPIHALMRIASGMLWVVEQIAVRGWRSTRVTWEVMGGEDHVSLLSRALSNGVRAVHGRTAGLKVDIPA